MIETMKKVSVVCLASSKEEAVKTMQRLGSLHVVPVAPTISEPLEQARKRQDGLQRVLDCLGRRGVQPRQATISDSEAGEAFEKGLRALNGLAEADAAEAAIRKDMELLEPWGSFSQDDIKALAENGLFVTLCAADLKAFAKGTAVPPMDGAVCRLVAICGNTAYFAVISDHSLADTPLPRAALPSNSSLQELQVALSRALEKRVLANTALDELAATAIPALRRLLAAAQDDTAFLAARDGMGAADSLAYINGYIPETRLDGLLAAARKCGWAVRYEAIADDDQDVPTLLRIPKRFAMAQAIFDCVGILPGYFETDVSIAMYLFLALFCGMLIGDAGYGAILSIITWHFLRKATAPAARNGLSVLLTLSLCTFVFGWLSGNWFGIPNSKLCAPFSGLPWLAQDDTQNHIKLLCFFIGAVHTSLAHIWLIAKAKGNLHDIIGNAGWAMFLWANFLAVAKLVAGGIPHTDTLMYVLYAIGFVAILTCSINWRSFGDVIYSPFSFINSFVDILSYIRLFAVGLSGVYIADSFNKMSATIWDVSPWLIPVGIIILFIGHLLNIAMAALSILVHGIRLNTLEFSGHIGLTWSGRPYEPLKENPRP